MTQWTPLEYITSLVVFSLIITYAVACQFSHAVREATEAIPAGMLQVLYWLLGGFARPGARIARTMFWMIYSLAELWGPRTVADMAWSLWQDMIKYGDSWAHVPRHRHGLAS